MIKFILRKKSLIILLLFISCLSGNFLLSQSKSQIYPPVDTSIPLSWTNGYTLILLQNSDMLSVNEAKDFIIHEGGTVAIFSNAHVMLGWISPGLATKIIGKHGIEAVFSGPVNPDSLRYQDEFTISLTNFFNSVVTGEVAKLYASFRIQGNPLVDDIREHPFVDPNSIMNNLENKHISWDKEITKMNENQGIFSGYSDYMTGTIAVCLMFIESDGSIDGSYYSWTTSAMNSVIDQCLSGASWWSDKAATYGQSASFYVYYYDPTRSVMQQGYEPIRHPSSDDYLWINKIMSNLGFSSGTKFDRVTSFNAWLKNWASTNWAYSCFVAYNPTGAPSTFTDGYFAYAYYGGPYTQMLYRNNGWSTSDTWSVFAHDTGYIFWACGEWYQAGYGGCTSCDPCNSFRRISNGNCEHPSCNPNSVPCIMRSNENAICAYTAKQVGWQVSLLTIQSGQGGTTNPSPGTYVYNLGSQVQVTAIPDTNYEFANWTGDVSSTQNPVTVTMDADKTFKANFRLKPKLTIQSSSYGTTSPVPGAYYYATGTQVQVTAIPDTYAIFINWTGSATGSTNPVSLTMDSDKSLYAHFHYIYAPIATGRKVLNRTFSQAEYINILSWQANPSNDGLDITKYRIYQMSGTTPSLLVELASSQLEYYHRNAGQASIQYTIVAVTSSNREGAPATVTVQ